MLASHCDTSLLLYITDIEAALQKIDEVKSNQEGIAAEEALILRGCVTTSNELILPVILMYLQSPTWAIGRV